MSLRSQIATAAPTAFALRDAVGMGFAAIRAYKMRAALTILGVVMGIMTVTGMSSIVAGLNASMAKQIEGLGSSVIFIRPFRPGEQVPDDEWRRRKGLSEDEIRALKERCTAVRSISPIEILRADTIRYGNQRLKDAQIFGMTASYETVHDLFVQKGRFISDTDVARGSAVVVIGAEVAESLFPFVDPLDKDLQIDTRHYRVIGVLEKKGKFLFMNRDNVILVPLGAGGKRDPRLNFLVADAKPVSAAQMDLAMDQICAFSKRTPSGSLPRTRSRTSIEASRRASTS
jgi:putative ABC transport system permease protein